MPLFPGASLVEKLQELASRTRGNLLGVENVRNTPLAEGTQPELMCSLHPQTQEGFVVSGCFLQGTEVAARASLKQSPATVALSVAKMKTSLSKARHALLLAGLGLA